MLRIGDSTATNPLLGDQYPLHGLPPRTRPRTSTTSSFNEDNPPQKGCWGCFQRGISRIGSALWEAKKGIIGTATVAGGIAVRVLNLFPVTNACSSAVIGMGARVLLPSKAPVIHRVAMGMFFGYSTITFLAQLYRNVEDLGLPSWVEPFCSSGIIVDFGANAADFLISYYDRPGNQIPSRRADPSQSTFKEEIFFPKAVTFPLYTALSIASAVGAFLYPSKEVRAVLSYFACFWPAEIGAEALKAFINGKIREVDAQGPQQRWWNLKKRLDTAAPVFITLSFGATAIWGRPEVFAAAGATAGFFEGGLGESIRDRLVHVPIQKLRELKPHPAEETPNPGYLRLKFGYLAINLAWFLAFVAWQEGLDLKGQPEAQIELWCFAGSFLVVLTTTEGLQRAWVVDERILEENPSNFKDSLICRSLDPKLLDVPLAYFFFVSAAALDLSDLGIEEVNDEFILFIRRLGWIGYGASWASEYYWQSLARRTGLSYRRVSLSLLQGITTGSHVAFGTTP